MDLVNVFSWHAAAIRTFNHHVHDQLINIGVLKAP